MLVLSRKVDEQLVIGDNIVVRVTKISGNRVSIAIDAPNDVKITRGELIERELTQASSEAPARQGRGAAASVHVAAKPDC
ncbi:carbon storage regulator [Rhodopirellula sp. JC740]|uniref:Translational regulator CsrA n=1 Tax=Rhodopirellula halodulae TaxID=2894198 RepID=A0ABS8NHT5_9BACT|nr:MULTISPECIES: carbon storage regulator [unclassified Rhodopirellula]MCC9642041.1 carbon storage regulator [Rhodopirellula sp. JC740]MCC9658343.1 carbon storage regulator [Rhodopirellula sp. JC737]